MAKTAYEKILITGGGATALDGIDGAGLLDGDFAFVFVGGLQYNYVLDDDLNCAEASPKFIVPDANPGTKVWVLQNTIPDKPLTNLLTNSQWMAMSGSTLETVGAAVYSDTDGSTFASWDIQTGGGTITDGGANLLLTDNNGNTNFRYAAAGLTAGKLYKATLVLADGTGTWGANDVITARTAALAVLASTSVTAAGTYTLVWEAAAANDVILVSVSEVAIKTYNITSVTLYEVTPGYVAADAVGPDGWNKEVNIDVWRQHNDATYTKNGSFYSLKLTTGGVSQYISWPKNSTEPSFVKRVAGRTVTFGVWAYATDASHAGLRIYRGATNGYTSYVYHSGVAGWEWLELTATIDSDAAEAIFYLYSSASGKTAYFSQPMLIFGNSIGQGNYQPIPNEQILGQANIALTGYTATTGAADGIINLEAASAGKIGKGVKAVLVKAYGKDSAAGDGVGFDVQSASGVEDGISVDTQVNNIRVQGQGWVKCDANGDIYLDHRGSGTAALTIDLKVIGVET